MSKEDLPGLYVHIPFCLSKCPYCDFYSETGTSMVSAWLAALEQEMLLYKDSFQKFDTLYIGGGTPTVLGQAVLQNLFDKLYGYFSFTDGAEITVEAPYCDRVTVTFEPQRVVELVPAGCAG